MDNWSKEIPKEPGFYWFYGDPFSNNPRPQDVKIYLIEIRITSSGHPFYICSGAFISNKNGLWQKAILPEIPS